VVDEDGVELVTAAVGDGGGGCEALTRPAYAVGCRYVELVHGDWTRTSRKAAAGVDVSMGTVVQGSSPNPWAGGSWLSEPAVSVVVSSKKLRLNSSVVPAPNDTSAVSLSADGAPPSPAAND